MNEKRIYVVIPEVIEVTGLAEENRRVVQPAGRQIAQACHVVSKLRYWIDSTAGLFTPITTIILQARDSSELNHIYHLISGRRLPALPVAIFEDTNPDYGHGGWPTALAVLATPPQIVGILDYLPLWK